MSRRSLRRTTRPALALVAAAAAASLALTACGASTSNDTADTASSTEAGPGVSADAIKVGFVVRNKATSAGGGGFVVADQGDTKAQVDAMVAYVNANGGIAGKQITPVIRTFESSTDSPQTESALCNAFTKDDKVFAVVLVAQRLPVARTCYKKANTVMVDVGGNSLAQSDIDDVKPYYWSLATPAFDDALEALVPTLKERGFFDGTKVGVLVEKSPGYEGLVDKVLKPAVEAAGSTISSVATIDQSTADNAGATSRSAVAQLKADKVTALMFVGRPDNSGYYTGTAFPQNFFPRLSITTFEDPNFLISNPAFSPPSTLKGSIGIGVAPATDGVAATYPFPSTDAQKKCIDTIYKPAGITFEKVTNAKSAMLYCDAALFLQAVGNKIGAAGTFNAQNFATAAYGLGETWQAAASLHTKFADGVHAPSDGYRLLAYKDGGTYEYSGDDQSLSQK
jgi:ABC-type branched-subunit amino acid transport system substrate-binding protein